MLKAKQGSDVPGSLTRVDNVSFVPQAKRQNGKGAVVDHASDLRDENRGVVALPAKVSKENAGQKRGVPRSQPWILFYIPSRRKSIGMHNQRRFRLPRIRELLEFPDRVSHGSIHGYHASGLVAGTNRGDDIARPRIIQDAFFVKNLRNRNGSSTRLTEGGMDLDQELFRSIIVLKMKDANRLDRCFRGKRSVP